MHDDVLMDHLLRGAMAGTVPQLSAGFDNRVMRRVRPRRLTHGGRIAIVLYFVLAAAAAAWAMRGLDAGAIIAGLVSTAPIALVTMAYGRRLASAVD